MKIKLYEYIVYEDNKRLSKERFNALKTKMNQFSSDDLIFDKSISKKPMKIQATISSSDGRYFVYQFIKCEREISKEDLINNIELTPISEDQYENIENLGISKEDFVILDVKKSRVLLSRIFDTTKKALKMLRSFDELNFQNIQLQNMVDDKFIETLNKCKSIEFEAVNEIAFNFNDDLKDTANSIEKISNNFNAKASKLKVTEPSKIHLIKKIFKNKNISPTVFIAEVSNDEFDYIFNSDKSTLAIYFTISKGQDADIQLQEILSQLEEKND